MKSGTSAKKSENKIIAGIKYVIALGILVGFLGGGFVLVTVPLEMLQMQAARSWPARPGTVTISSVTRSHSMKYGESFQPNINGTYDDTGERFWISRVRYGDVVFGSGKQHSERLSAKYPRGSKVQVHYNPANPNETVLEPDAPWDTLNTALGVGAALFSLPFLLYLYGRLTGYQPPEDDERT